MTPEAYRYFIKMYKDFCFMSSDGFATFTNPKDTTSVVLQAHFLAIEAILKPWIIDQAEREKSHRNGIEAVASSASLGYHKPIDHLIRWPLNVLAEEASAVQKLIDN